MLLGVVPGAASVGLEDRHQHAGDGDARQHAAQGVDVAPERLGAEAHDDGGQHGDQARHDHLLDRGVGGDVDALGVLGRGRALHQPGDLFELAAHLDDHLLGRPAHSGHGEGGEEEGQHGADEQASHDDRLADVDDRHPDHGLEGGEERQGGQGGGADGEALADGGGGVAHGVELVGALANLGLQLGHLGDAAGVVSDGAVGVHGQLDAGGGEHAQRGDGDAVEAGVAVGQHDGHGQHDHRQGGGAHAQGQAGDDVGGRAGGGLGGDAPCGCA